MSSRPRFLTDDMLGSLTRWLRIMGYDTVYAKSLHVSDDEIAALALRGKRTLVTRDRGLHKKVSGAVLIKSTRVEEQLKELVGQLRLRIPKEPRATLCPLCNGVVVEIEKESHKKDIPPLTYEHVNKFWRCTSCGQLYWPGKHWERIIRLLHQLAINPPGRM